MINQQRLPGLPDGLKSNQQQQQQQQYGDLNLQTTQRLQLMLQRAEREENICHLDMNVAESFFDFFYC